MNRLVKLFLFYLCLITASAQATIEGRVDIGYAWIDIDVLESGKTVDRMHVNSVKGDATISIYKGLCVKPGFVWGSGDGDIESFTLAMGQYFPLTERFAVLPYVGVGYGRIHTHIDIPEFGLFHLKEQFHSVSPYIGLDVNFKPFDRCTIFGIVQYIWSSTDTKIENLPKDKSHSEGFNYALVFEYEVYKNFCLSLAGGYNTSLTKEKHGFRMKGAKIGLAYYF